MGYTLFRALIHIADQWRVNKGKGIRDGVHWTTTVYLHMFISLLEDGQRVDFLFCECSVTRIVPDSEQKLSFCFCFSVLGIEPRVLHMKGKCSANACSVFCVNISYRDPLAFLWSVQY
jgi:hypothetical protein